MAAPITVTANSPTDKPPRPRRWIPLSLRLFVAMLVILGVGSALRIAVPAYRQYAAIREIQRLGGKADFCRVGPPWLRDLVGIDRMRMFDRVFSITLDKKRATDSTMRQISRLATGPTSLSLSNTQVTDAGLAYLAGLNDLQSLMLDGTQVTDAGLAHVKRMKNLLALDLSGTHVTDDGIAELTRALPECEIYH